MLFHFTLPGKGNDSNWSLARPQLKLLQEIGCSLSSPGLQSQWDPRKSLEMLFG